ncbi:hypothetical protein HQQ81_16085 [Microbacteriaceae bacterium VKM Ac-2854]|nr:hypothetical protein [Microbacteriaceae bacterium VKM Ac-2854]
MEKADHYVARIKAGPAAGAIVLFSKMVNVRHWPRRKETYVGYVLSFWPRRIPIGARLDGEWDDHVFVSSNDGSFESIVVRWKLDFAPENIVPIVRRRLFGEFEGPEEEMSDYGWGRVSSVDALRQMVVGALANGPGGSLVDPDSLGYIDETLEWFVAGADVSLGSLIEQLEYVGLSVALVPTRGGSLRLMQGQGWSEFAQAEDE